MEAPEVKTVGPNEVFHPFQLPRAPWISHLNTPPTTGESSLVRLAVPQAPTLQFLCILEHPQFSMGPAKMSFRAELDQQFLERARVVLRTPEDPGMLAFVLRLAGLSMYVTTPDGNFSGRFGYLKDPMGRFDTRRVGFGDLTRVHEPITFTRRDPRATHQPRGRVQIPWPWISVDPNDEAYKRNIAARFLLRG